MRYDRHQISVKTKDLNERNPSVQQNKDFKVSGTRLATTGAQVCGAQVCGAQVCGAQVCPDVLQRNSVSRRLK